MTKFQEAIKYMALAAAILLAVGIIAGIVGVIGMIFGFGGSEKLLEESVQIEISQNIKSLQIDVGAAELTIIEGERFALSSNIKDLRVSESNGTLSIVKNQKKVSIHSNKIGEIVLTVPVGTVLERFGLNAGAGDVKITRLVAEVLDVELGAGKVDIEYLEARKNASVDAGAGKFQIKGGRIHNLDVDFGVGKSEIRAALTGESYIDSGVGSADIVLLGNKNDYHININSGIGSVHVDGDRISGSASVGNGSNVVFIDGGVGNIDVDFENE